MSELRLTNDGWQRIALGRREAEFFELENPGGVTFVLRQSAWRGVDDATQDQFLTGICTLLYCNWLPRAPARAVGAGEWEVAFFSITAHPQAPEFSRRERLVFEFVNNPRGELICLHFLRGEDLRLVGGLPLEISNLIGVPALATGKEIQEFTDVHTARERAA